jgi:hypothetical protein
MPLAYRLAADGIVVLHAAYVLFVIFGLLLTVVGCLARWKWIRNPWFRGVHLAMIGIVVFEAWWGITCPLTTWEQALRERAGQSAYQGAFLANLVHNWLFYDAPPWVFTAAYTAFGLAVLATLFIAPPRFRRQSRP